MNDFTNTPSTYKSAFLGCKPSLLRDNSFGESFAFFLFWIIIENSFFISSDQAIKKAFVLCRWSNKLYESISFVFFSDSLWDSNACSAYFINLLQMFLDGWPRLIKNFWQLFDCLTWICFHFSLNTSLSKIVFLIDLESRKDQNYPIWT